MSGTWKGVALTIIILLVIVFLYNLFNKPISSESDQAVRDQMTQRYYEHLERNEERDIEYFKKAEEQLVKVDEINERALKNQQRIEKLLDRWERQVDRFDRVLIKMEKMN